MKHRGTPKAGAIIGAVMGRYPGLRPRAAEAKGLVGPVIAEVDALDHDGRVARLGALAPELLEVHEAGPRDRYALPPLPDAENGVVMRFAPNPSGPLHLGHARAAALNDAYVRQYRWPVHPPDRGHGPEAGRPGGLQDRARGHRVARVRHHRDRVPIGPARPLLRPRPPPDRAGRSLRLYLRERALSRTPAGEEGLPVPCPRGRG